MELVSLSEQLKDIHNSFKWINAGGCGEFAKLLGAKLRKNNIKFKYVLFSERDGVSVIESIRNFKNSGDEVNNVEFRVRNNYMIAHIMIYYKGHFIDSEGVHSNITETRWGYEYRISAILPQEVLKTWCKQSTWNTMFNRAQLPEIKKRIKKLQLN